ncbi:hypothetical protein Acr_24g0010420 [Actinidia rufa]|uniref:Uncharacterized protein n=1 Tax=Actinidia rufa TaxID=165716 RepID=A0A7J0GVP1_9ERIC|nr:hypothetical protein Acr_24g0010420 [Actinidia rufa]
MEERRGGSTEMGGDVGQVVAVGGIAQQVVVMGGAVRWEGVAMAGVRRLSATAAVVSWWT